MADKRIIDFPLLDEVSEDDYVLISSNNNTYKAKAGAFGEFSGGKGGYFKKVFSGTAEMISTSATEVSIVEFLLTKDFTFALVVGSNNDLAPISNNTSDCR